MKAKLKAKWVEALRSGKYEQGKYYLSKGGKFCCLGVLCDVRGLPTGRNNDLYPYPVQDVLSAHDCAVLTDMNDKGKSFAEIADYIEQHIPAE